MRIKYHKPVLGLEEYPIGSRIIFKWGKVWEIIAHTTKGNLKLKYLGDELELMRKEQGKEK